MSTEVRNSNIVIVEKIVWKWSVVDFVLIIEASNLPEGDLRAARIHWNKQRENSTMKRFRSNCWSSLSP